MKTITGPMSSKEISKHIQSIKIIKNNGYGVKFIVSDETYDISALTRFCFSACFIGVVYVEKTGKEKLSLPTKIVWKLADFIPSLQLEESTLTESHNKILEYAEKLLAEENLFNTGDKRRSFSVTFDLCGKDAECFKEQLRLSLFWSDGFH